MGGIDTVHSNGVDEQFAVPKVMAKGLGFPHAKETHSVLSAMSPELISLGDLHTDIAAFQGRRHEYSELSVQRIILDIKRGDFLFHMMDPVRLWRNPEDKKLYILAGHSRVEAFRRLSTDEELKNDPNVQKFMEYWNIDFTKVPCNILPSYLTLPQAKRIALNSNSLGSHHTLTERAYYYYEKRKLIEIGEATWQEYQHDLKHYEGANAVIVDAYSYLSQSGKLICMVDALERTNSKDVDLSKVAYWTGIILKQVPELKSLHEEEMYEYLYKDGNYGKRDTQFSRFEAFRDFILSHIEQLKAANNFSPNNLLNLKGAQRLSLAMKTYNQMMGQLAEKKRVIEKQVKGRMRSLNSSILDKNAIPDLFSEQKMDEKLQELGGMKQGFAYLEEELKKICDTVMTDKDAQAALKKSMDLIQSVQLQIKKHKDNKEHYVLASLNELTLDFGG